MNANVIRKVILVAIFVATAVNSQAVSPQTVSAEDKAQGRIAREARHEIVTLPYFDVFDNIELRLDGYTLTLSGQVTKPSLKAEAESALREIEGVERVVNNIEVLPLSPNDDRLRMATYHAIYGFSPLLRYAMPPLKPIRIIVKNGNLSLEGVVDTEADRNLVRIRANGVSGLFSVTNNLRVER
jgi:hyperosmotically inducible protein